PSRVRTGSPLIKTRPVTHDQARRQMQSVRARLSHTIQDYLAACQLVQATCAATPQPSYPTSADHEQTLLAIDMELSTFSAEETSMRQAREILTDTRNQSKMTAPVYSLPSEVLTRIFSEATCHCISAPSYDSAPPILSPVTLSAVCRQWRRVAGHHRSLWTHLDLGVSRLYTNRGYYPPEIWAERSQGAPLYINVHQYRTFADGDTDSDGDYPSVRDDALNPAPMVARLLHFLSPLMNQVCSMTVVLYSPSEYIVTRLLDYWASYGIAGKGKVLKIELNPGYRLVEISSPLFYARVLKSLEVLHFYNVLPRPWSNWSLGNLVDFRLGVPLDDQHWSMTQSELAFVLGLCPKLQYFELSGLQIQRSRGPTPSPATLNELRVLDIGCITADMLVSVLAVINPGGNPLRLEISLSPDCTNTNKAIVAMHLFLERSNVTTLHLISSGEPCFASQIGPLPHVQTLVLNHCYFSDVANVPCYTEDSDVYVNPRPIDPGVVLWPQLRALYLEDCILEKEHLHRLVSLHSIQTLYMRDCYNGQEANEQFAINPQTAAEYVQLLSELVSKVAYFVGEQGVWPLLSN
ncbi:hypothetical protein FRC06_009213, partial [Ceratobasidium sp. 370]